MRSCAPESATTPSIFISTKPLAVGKVNVTLRRGWSPAGLLCPHSVAFMWRDAVEMRASGDDLDEESESNARAAAFVFLPPFLMRFSDLHLDRQQSRHSSYGRVFQPPLALSAKSK